MKIYSWNVNGLRAVLRKNALQDFLATEKPDIVCLQEIKAKKDQVEVDFPEFVEYWNPADRAGYSGTATFVANNVNCLGGATQHLCKPSESAEKNAELTDTEGRILVTEFPYFYLVNVYTPNSKRDLSRLKLRENFWDPQFLNLLRHLEQTKPVIACGDFNAAHTPLDLARPDANTKNAGFTEEERQGIKNLLSAGFVDTFRYFYPGIQRYTWWSHWGNARANNVGWRIDYFFISPKLLPYLKNAEIHEHIAGSDHCPVSITLDLPL